MMMNEVERFELCAAADESDGAAHVAARVARYSLLRTAIGKVDRGQPVQIESPQNPPSGDAQ